VPGCDLDAHMPESWQGNFGSDTATSSFQASNFAASSYQYVLPPQNNFDPLNNQTISGSAFDRRNSFVSSTTSYVHGMTTTPSLSHSLGEFDSGDFVLFDDFLDDQNYTYGVNNETIFSKTLSSNQLSIPQLPR